MNGFRRVRAGLGGERPGSSSAFGLMMALLLLLAFPIGGEAQVDEPSAERPAAEASEKSSPGDLELQTRIETRLARSRSLAGSEIDVEVDGYTALLVGWVGGADERERAIRIAQATPGIQAVISQLELDPTAVEERLAVRLDDKVLARQVAERLVEDVFPWARVREDWAFGWEVDGYSWDFDVEADDGDIRLVGTVPTRQHVARAVTVARAIPGVWRVDGDLRVDPFAFGGYDAPPRDAAPLEWQPPDRE